MSLNTCWYTFGQSHVHYVNGRVFDRDTVVEITAPDPRVVMVETFGRKWAMEYTSPPDMRFYPRGIIKLDP